MAFWQNPELEPKRAYRFLLRVNGGGNVGRLPEFLIKKVSKPSFEISESPHNFLNHTFYYPGAVKLQSVAMTLVDPGNPDASGLLASIVQQSKYAVPATPSSLTTMSKGAAVSALGVVTIKQLDAEGAEVETWTLNNAFITEAKFGSLEYGNDDLTTVELTLQYDWAQCELTGVEAPTSTGGTEFFKMGTA